MLSTLIPTTAATIAELDRAVGPPIDVDDNEWLRYVEKDSVIFLDIGPTTSGPAYGALVAMLENNLVAAEVFAAYEAQLK